MKLSPLVLAAFLVLAPPVALDAQSIHGRVVDAVSGAAVPEAAVRATETTKGGSARVRTGADGAFVLALGAPGTYRIRVERTGYAPATSQELTVEPGEAVEVSLRISAQALQIQPLTVVGRAAPRRVGWLEPTGFYDREKAGFGRFIRREEIERRRGNRLATILDDVPGVRLYRDGRGNEYVSFDRAQTNGAFSRAQRGETDVCLPVYFLDGTRVAAGAPDKGGVTPNDLVQPEQVEAIEVYGSVAQLPPRFNASDAACGVVVIWTRAGR